VREFVHEHELGPPRKHGIEVHLASLAAIRCSAMARDDFQLFQQRFCLLAAARFDCADHNVHPRAVLGDAGTDHLARRADAGRGTQEDLEAAASLSPGCVSGRMRRGCALALCVRRLRAKQITCLHGSSLGSIKRKIERLRSLKRTPAAPRC
jgi:hypothetical protein